jgi:hypothetical protein
MRTIKVIIGIGCIIASIIPGLPVLGKLYWGYFNMPFAWCFLGLLLTGGFFIRERNSPISWKTKALATPVLCVIAGFMVVIVIPNFIGGWYQTAGNSCINNLRQIDAAKYEWALENHKTNGAFVTENDLTPYIKLDAEGNIPKCGLGGKYIIGRVGEDPECTIGTAAWPNVHALNYTNSGWQNDFKMAYGRLFGLKVAP